MTYESDTDFNKLSIKTSYLSHTAPHAPCTFSSLSINSYIQAVWFKHLEHDFVLEPILP